MGRFALTSIGFISLLAVPCFARTYAVDGIVVDLARADQTMLVSHRPIAGYMTAMTMRFHVANAKELSGVEPGDRVQFELLVDGGTVTARKIHRVPQNDVEVRLPTDRFRVGDLVPDFTLKDQTGRLVRLSDFRGRVVVIDFIYTRCPVADMCPRLSANMAAVQARFGKAAPHDLQLLSITIDPLYDTPEVLKDYAARWNTDPHFWLFLTGTSQQIRYVAEKFGLIYWPEEDAITHNATTTIVGRDGKVAAIVDGSNYRLGQLCDLISSQIGGTP